MERENRVIEREGYRYETCSCCGERWNIPQQLTLQPEGYICPGCERRREYRAWAAKYKAEISR